MPKEVAIGAPVPIKHTDAIDAALHEVQQAQAELRKLQAVYSKGSTYHSQCEVIDNHLHDALNILGNHRG